MSIKERIAPGCSLPPVFGGREEVWGAPLVLAGRWGGLCATVGSWDAAGWFGEGGVVKAPLGSALGVCGMLWGRILWWEGSWGGGPGHYPGGVGEGLDGGVAARWG